MDDWKDNVPDIVNVKFAEFRRIAHELPEQHLHLLKDFICDYMDNNIRFKSLHNKVLRMLTGAVLKEVREKKGLSMRETADLLGLTKQMINLWEKGSRPIGYDHKVKIYYIFEEQLNTKYRIKR